MQHSQAALGTGEGIHWSAYSNSREERASRRAGWGHAVLGRSMGMADSGGRIQRRDGRARRAKPSRTPTAIAIKIAKQAPGIGCGSWSTALPDISPAAGVPSRLPAVSRSSLCLA